MVARGARGGVFAIVVTGLVLAGILPGVFIAPAQGGDGGTAYHLYFGDLHTHTTWSDGWEGTPADAFAAAKAAGADFLATTDHASRLTPEEWTLTRQMAAAATTDTFAALPAYEFWVNGRGELNVYDPPAALPNDDHAFHSTLEPRQTALASFYDWVAAQPGAVAQWNHPEYMSKSFDGFAYRTDTRDAGIGLLEIHNYGSWTWKGIVDYEPAYIQALDAGWHVMPAANSDTHNPDWISGYQVRTVLLAPSLSPENLYAAMRASRGYATLDKNLRIEYALNGAVMGSTLSPAASYLARIRIDDPDGVPSDAITLVEIVSDRGAVVARLPADGTAVDWQIRLSSATARYFYVRVSTASSLPGLAGVTAWTAPVWTGR